MMSFLLTTNRVGFNWYFKFISEEIGWNINVYSRKSVAKSGLCMQHLLKNFPFRVYDTYIIKEMLNKY